MEKNKYTILDSKVVFKTPLYSIRQNFTQCPVNPEPANFYILETFDWCNIIPITKEREVVMVRQYRHGVNHEILEIPGGVLNRGEKPEKAASRELEEETGYIANDIKELGWTYPNPAIQNNRCFFYYSDNISNTGKQKFDPYEDIKVELVPISEIKNLLKKGVLSHSLVAQAFGLFFLDYKG